MTSVPGVDHPEEQTEAEITLTGRGVSVTARVEVVQDDRISVRPSVGEFVEQVVVKVGDVVEDGPVRLMADRADHRCSRTGYGPDQVLIAEGEQVLQRPAATGDDNDVNTGILIELPQCADDL